MLRFFIIFLQISFFSFSVNATEEKNIYDDWSDDLICDKAWDSIDSQWSKDPVLLTFVKIAKDRQIDCNPNKLQENLIKVRDDNFLFPIEGLNIGEIIDLRFTPREIVNNLSNSFNLSDEFYHAKFYNHKSFKMYDALELIFQKNEEHINFPISGIAGLIYYDGNIEDCYKDKQKVVNKIKIDLNDAKMEGPKVLTYPEDKSGKSKYEVNHFHLEDGLIRVICYDMSESFKILDTLSVEILSKEAYKWLGG